MRSISDSLHCAIDQHYPFLSQDQRHDIGQTDTPLLIIAGPGSGKTFTLGGALVAVLGIAAAIYYAIESYTDGQLLVIALLLAVLVLLVATTG